VTSPLRVRETASGRLLHLTLDRPKANLIDAAMIAALDAALAANLDTPGIGAVLIDAEGPHFSFGASVEEHLPGQCASMLRGLHDLIRRMLDSPVPILVAVQGQCLGGGLEVALAGHLLFAAPDAALGQPEMKLGVFAPAASCLLPELIGPQRAFDLLLSGRSISGTEAVAMGLALQSADPPSQAALTYFAEQLEPKSSSSIRHAVRAARAGFATRVQERLAAVERQYLDELMGTQDAVEGLEAFIAKRKARWTHR